MITVKFRLGIRPFNRVKGRDEGIAVKGYDHKN